MSRAILALLVGAIALTGCADTASQSDEPPTKTIAAHGVSISIPESWDGRVEWDGPGFARMLHVGSFELPSRLDARGHEAERLLEGDDIYLNIALDPELSAPSRPEMRRQQLVNEWEGKVPEAAVRATLEAEPGLQAWVTFGSSPTAEQVEQTNAILATLQASPA